ncbi:hypothetical protein B0H10DRAFT_2218347 [Mycena sp. CBHHK59/15]|nr:hypothetical protein B0H10DRAFT_2218347 [Mycena sp. CBHHK59/15]
MLGVPDFRHPYLRPCEGVARATIWLIRRDLEDVKGTRFVECRRRRKDRHRDPPSVTASVGCSDVMVGSCHRRWVAVAILAPPSALDKPGALYIFEIPADQPNRRTCHALARAQIRMAKIGHSKHPWKRWAQWLCKCWGQQQDWWAYWNVLYAAKFEALIHLHFKLLGAWMLPSECHFCGVRHTENFGFRACGGRAGIARVVVFYLRCLGWPVDEVAM